MIKLRNLFEDPILKGKVRIVHRRKKIENKFHWFYYIEKADGEVIGRVLGYDNKEQAVRDLLSMKDKNFLKKNTVKQKELIDRYIEKNKL